MDAKPKRRWLRFSVRTLLVAVTIFCMWLGWQVSIVRERKAVQDLVLGRHAKLNPGYKQPKTITYFVGKPYYEPPRSWFRQLLGDVGLITVRADSFTADELARIK